MAPGITAAELLERCGHRGHRTMRPSVLERWLLDAGLAENGDGQLRPTSLCLDLAEGLSEVRFYPSSRGARRRGRLRQPD